MLHHLCPEQQNVKPLVKWKDLLSRQWKGPDPLLTGGRGCACIFLQDADLPIWILYRLIRHVTVPQAPGSSTATTTKKKKGTPLPLPPPVSASARNSRALGAAGGANLAAGTQLPHSQPVAPPASLCTCLAIAGPEASLARGQGLRSGARRLERQDKHRDPSKTDGAAATRTPTRK